MGCGCGGSTWTPPPAEGERDPSAPTGPGAPGYYHTAGEPEAVVVSENGQARRIPVRKL